MMFELVEGKSYLYRRALCNFNWIRLWLVAPSSLLIRHWLSCGLKVEPSLERIKYTLANLSTKQCVLTLVQSSSFWVKIFDSRVTQKNRTVKSKTYTNASWLWPSPEEPVHNTKLSNSNNILCLIDHRKHILCIKQVLLWWNISLFLDWWINFFFYDEKWTPWLSEIRRRRPQA